MPQRLEPKFGVLPPGQREIWPSLAPAPELNFVLYGGTAVALHLEHRASLILTFSGLNRWTRITYVQRSGLLTEPLSCRILRIRWWCLPKCHLVP
jgi:hypothetical protein